MKIAKFGPPCIGRLAYFASTDETRFHLTGVYMDDLNARAVSTDGHRMYVSKVAYLSTGETKGGRLVRTDILASEMRSIPLDVGETKYPNWKQLAPKVGSAWNKVVLDVPSWIEVFKTRGKSKINLVLDAERGELLVGPVASSPHRVAINFQLVAPFAGENVQIAFKDSQSHLVMIPPGADWKTYETEADWYAVVMPLRDEGGSRISVHNKTNPKVQEGEKMSEVSEVKKPNAEVFSIVGKLNEKKVAEETAKNAADNLVCQFCSHRHESMDDWNVGFDEQDFKMTAGDFLEETQSGTLVCEKCEKIQEDRTIFDEYVMVTPDNPFGYVNVNIPQEAMEEAMDPEQTSGKDAKMFFEVALSRAVFAAVNRHKNQSGKPPKKEKVLK